ncbi:MAG TPA: GNAT family N-acetyltransferase [Candidatus Tumulicola sp.]|nr:GNAT family N-acetyltransferase [Candidatus Tumulicola sp.]
MQEHVKSDGTLQTVRLVLRVGPSDAATRLAQYYRDNAEHLRPWAPVPADRFFSAAFWEEALDRDRHEFLERRSARFVIFARDYPNGPVLGQCNFSEFVSGIFQACYLGYALDRRCVGKGFMTEALSAAIPFVFETIGMHRIMANYMPANERSGALLRKLGFEVEGFARNYLYINGGWQDHILTALTNPNPSEPVL